MIKTEFYKVREDGVNLYKTYSDLDLRIHCNEDGHDYDEAVNVQDSGYTFIETDQPIIHYETEEYDPREAVQAVHILLDR